MEKLKFTERFMEIPIRMYQADEIESLLEERRLSNSTDPIDPDYAIGYVRISPYDVMEWYDSFSRPRTVDEVRKEGFDCTRVKTRSGDIYDCVWTRQKFEDRLNKFVDKIEDIIEKEDKDIEDLEL